MNKNNTYPSDRMYWTYIILLICLLLTVVASATLSAVYKYCISLCEVQLLVCLSIRSIEKERDEVKEIITRIVVAKSSNLAILSQCSQ